jgi:predicted ArsR family transcriptional regulator
MDYNTNKEKMKSILSQKEKDIEDMLNSHKITVSEMNKETNLYKSINKNKGHEYEDLIKAINEKDNEIEELKYLLNEQNRKYINECNERMETQKKVEELLSILNDIKGKNIYLNRITHGKLK